MARRTPRRRIPAIDWLERREVPSAVAPGLFPPAARSAPVATYPFFAIGTAGIAGDGPSRDSSTFAAEVRGVSNRIGVFTGRMVVTTHDAGPADVAMTLVGWRGATIRIAMRATGSGGDHGEPGTFAGRFTIEGGTTWFAGAGGGGEITGTVDPAARAIRFELRGAMTR